jgi:hypothetical protein
MFKYLLHFKLFVFCQMKSVAEQYSADVRRKPAPGLDIVVQKVVLFSRKTNKRFTTSYTLYDDTYFSNRDLKD